MGDRVVCKGWDGVEVFNRQKYRHSLTLQADETNDVDIIHVHVGSFTM